MKPVLKTFAAMLLLTVPGAIHAQDSLPRWRLAAERDSARKTPAYTVTRAELTQDPAQLFAQYLYPPELIMQHQAA